MSLRPLNHGFHAWYVGRRVRVGVWLGWSCDSDCGTHSTWVGVGLVGVGEMELHASHGFGRRSVKVAQ